MQYATIAQSYIDRIYGTSTTRVFKTVFPSWDNTARTHSRALVVLNGTPENYEYWLSSTIDIAQRSNNGDQLVFINASTKTNDMHYTNRKPRSSGNASGSTRKTDSFYAILIPLPDRLQFGHGHFFTSLP